MKTKLYPKLRFVLSSIVGCFLLATIASPAKSDLINYHGFNVSPLGNAVIDEDDDADGLFVDNLGSSGKDGVRLAHEIEKRGTVTILKLAPGNLPDPSGGSPVGAGVSVSSTADGADFILWNAHKFTSSFAGTGNTYNFSVDAAGANVSSTMYQLFHEGSLVGEFAASNGEVVNLNSSGGLEFTEVSMEMARCGTDNDCNDTDPSLDHFDSITMSFKTTDLEGFQSEVFSFFDVYDELRVTKNIDFSFAANSELAIDMLSTGVNSFRINDASLSSVPEPSGLVAILFASIVMLRRSRTRDDCARY